MRFLLYFSLLLAILPLVMLRPFFGLCVYYLVSLLQPKYFCWRPDLQDAMLVGVPMVVGAIAIGMRQAIMVPVRDRANRIVALASRVVRTPLFQWAWPFSLCALLVVYISVTRLLVFDPLENSSAQYRVMCKTLLVMVLLTGLACELHRFRILYIVVALATAFWAIKGGLKVIILGPHQVYGRTYDNNFFALTSVMALPMVFYFALSVKHARWRPVLLVCAALICLGVIGSRSRAGFVAFAVVLGCMAWSSRYRLQAVFAAGLVAVAAWMMAGQEIRQRVTSILEYRTDRSAVSRFYTWEVARRLVAAHPLIGVGFGNFEIAREREIGGRKAAHNIYLQNAAELGWLGNPLWLAIILGTLFSLYRFMRQSRRFPPEMRWAYYWSRGLLLGLVAFCIHGMFHNEEYLELMFVMVGLSVALKTVTRRELETRRLRQAVESTTACFRTPPHLGAAIPTAARSPPAPRLGLIFERPLHRRRSLQTLEPRP